MDRSEWVQLAEEEVLALVQAEKAVTWHELVARLGERPKTKVVRAYNPHILTDAVTAMTKSGRLDRFQHTARGGHVVNMVTLPRHVRGNQRAVADAVGFKGLAAAHYGSLSQGRRRQRNPIGAGLEDLLTASLIGASGSGSGVSYGLLGKGKTREVAGIGDFRFAGPVDNAATLNVFDETTMTSQTYVTIFEAKNLRDWIYPSRPEPFQLLLKCALLKQAHPGLPVVPVLVARQMQYTTFQLASALGFFGIQTGTQYVTAPEDADLPLLRERLGFDIVAFDGVATGAMVHKLSVLLPTKAPSTAERWTEMVPLISDQVASLQDPRIRGRDRRALYRELKEIAGLGAEFDDDGDYDWDE